MKQTQLSATAVALLALGSTFGVCFDAAACGAEPPLPAAAEEVDRLSRLGSDRRKAASSIDVVAFEFMGVVKESETGFSRDELLELLQVTLPRIVEGNGNNVGLNALSSATLALFPPLSNGKLSDVTAGAWHKLTLLRDADNARLDMSFGDETSSVIRTGTTEQQYSSGSRQASVFTTHSGRSIPNIDSFVYDPQLPSGEDREWQIQSTMRNGRRLSLHGPKGEAILVEYEPTMGFVTYHEMRLNERNILLQRYQSCPMVSASGVLIPRMFAELKYRPTLDDVHHLPSVLTIYVLLQVELGLPLQPSRFQLSVPAGTNIVRFDGADTHVPPSQGGVRPPMMRAEQPVQDVVTIAGSPQFERSAQTAIAPPAKSANSSSGLMVFLVVANLVAIVVVCGLLVSRRHQKH